MPGRRKDHLTIERLRLGVGAPSCGTYNPKDINSTKKSVPLFSVSKQRRDGELALFKNTPGSGAYHPDSAIVQVRASSASYSMGGAKRPKQQ